MTLRASLIAMALTFAAAPPARAQEDDPLAAARSGAIECLSPNVVARTCAQFTTYRFTEDGRIESESIALLQNDPEIVLYGKEVMYVRDGMVCSRVEPATFASLRFMVDGAPAPSDISNALRSVIIAALVGIEEVCSRSAANRDSFALTVYADGVEQPDLADTMIWVSPEDGFTLGAADAEGV